MSKNKQRTGIFDLTDVNAIHTIQLSSPKVFRRNYIGFKAVLNRLYDNGWYEKLFWKDVIIRVDEH